MLNRLFLSLIVLVGFHHSGVAAVHDEWLPVSDEQAVSFVEEFYTHMSLENGTWDDDVLEQNLAPLLLKSLADAVSDGDTKYASWLLSGTDESEMIKPSVRSHDAVATGDGRVQKELEVFYWADTWLRSIQTLYFTVKSKNGHLYITQIDGMDGSAAASVWEQLEARDEAREMEVVEGDDPLQRFEGNIGPYAITLFMNPSDMGIGNTVGNYYYNERPNSVFTLELVKNEAVNASGSMHIVLKEYTAKGNHTGTFDGQYECRGGGFVGTFTNAKAQKFKFELMEK